MLDMQQSVSGEVMSAVLCEIDKMTSTNLIQYTCRTCTNLDYLRSHEKEVENQNKEREKKYLHLFLMEHTSSARPG